MYGCAIIYCMSSSQPSEHILYKERALHFVENAKTRRLGLPQRRVCALRCKEVRLTSFWLRMATPVPGACRHALDCEIQITSLQTWQRPTLPRLKTKYHRRRGVSRPSSEWDRVQPPRHNHQVGGDVIICALRLPFREPAATRGRVCATVRPQRTGEFRTFGLSKSYAHRGGLRLFAPLGASVQSTPAQVPPRRSRVAFQRYAA